MRNTFKLSFFLKRSVVKKNGKSPIIGRITVNGEKVEFSTKLQVVFTKWSVDSGGAKEIMMKLNYSIQIWILSG